MILKKTKQGQIHITETIAVLFIFFVLLFFGLVFYYKYVDVSAKEQLAENLERRAVDSTTRFIFLPEVQCTQRELPPFPYCLDLLKLSAFKDVLSGDALDEYYFHLFSFAKITVQEVYPDPARSWVVYDKPKIDYSNKKVTYFSAALEDASVSGGAEPVVHFGYVVMEVYS
ncbi:hypothetical protein HY495_01825 [Candidatus Woesearchaeota archaeon]|nr:hypothetical protein [Candidatus Woesearchaeota archaeon]